MNLIKLREQERLAVVKNPKVFEYIVEAMNLGYCNTLIGDFQIICMVGMFPLWEGVQEIYLLPSVHMKDYTLPLMRILKTYFSNVAQAIPGLRRMQTKGWADPTNDRFLYALGFRAEGTHPNYGVNGETYRTWAAYVEDGKVIKPCRE